MTINKITCLLPWLLSTISLNAQNPVVQTYYTADPAPMVYDDVMYMYTTHDHDTAKTFFRMYDWRVYSTSDMVNWRDHGTALALADLDWADDRAWAAQTVFRNGKFYFYICAHHRELNQMAIGVAVSDKPTGPFKDALGKPLITQDWGDIDPTVFIDDDGQAYMYWGNPQLQYVKLNEDMVSYDEEVGIVKVPVTPASFGNSNRKNPERGGYVEGPWLHKQDDLYYLLYPAGGIPEHLAYSTSENPTGPWTYQGKIMEVIEEGGAFTNHPGLINYKGHSYLFYHNGALPGGGGFTRSVCVDEFQFTADGKIPMISPTKEGVKRVDVLDPLEWVEAETIAYSNGVKTTESDGEIFVSDIHNGDYIKVQAVDFGKGCKQFEGKLASINGGRLEIRLDSVEGALLGTVDVTGPGAWETLSTSFKKTKGVHDIYFVFRGESEEALFNFDSWKLSK